MCEDTGPPATKNWRQIRARRTSPPAPAGDQRIGGVAEQLDKYSVAFVAGSEDRDHSRGVDDNRGGRALTGWDDLERRVRLVDVAAFRPRAIVEADDDSDCLSGDAQGNE